MILRIDFLNLNLNLDNDDSFFTLTNHFPKKNWSSSQIATSSVNPTSRYQSFLFMDCLAGLYGWSRPVSFSWHDQPTSEITVLAAERVFAAASALFFHRHWGMDSSEVFVSLGCPRFNRYDRYFEFKSFFSRLALNSTHLCCYRNWLLSPDRVDVPPDVEIIADRCNLLRIPG